MSANTEQLKPPLTPNDFSQVPQDHVIAQRIDPGRKHVWHIAAPKSGSTWMSALLEKALGWRRLPLMSISGQREQEVDLRWLLAHPDENLFSPQQHCRASEATLNLIDQFSITPMLQVRNLFDTTVSLVDHLHQFGPEIPMGFVDDSFFNLSRTSQFDFVIDMILPWHFNFYGTWLTAIRDDPDRYFIIQYEQLRESTEQVLADALAFASEYRSATEIRRVITEVEGMETRLNSAEIGRGRRLLNTDQIARIRRFRAYYPRLDFSLIGIE